MEKDGNEQALVIILKRMKPEFITLSQTIVCISIWLITQNSQMPSHRYERIKCQVLQVYNTYAFRLQNGSEIVFRNHLIRC